MRKDPGLPEAEWINPPPAWRRDGEDLFVTTGDRTDFWRHTSYGFVHESGHALVSALPEGHAIEWSVRASFEQDFDQAGVMVWADNRHWIKCGLEYADGVLGLGAVVTNDVSDWSTAPVASWADQRVFLRVSRAGDAVTVRARVAGEPWQLVRLAPIDPRLPWKAGPHAASPSREGLEVVFSDFRFDSADEQLH